MRPARYLYGPHPAQYGELWLPGRAAVTTVVIIHGGFWRARYDLILGRPLAADLAAARVRRVEPGVPAGRRRGRLAGDVRGRGGRASTCSPPFL